MTVDPEKLAVAQTAGHLTAAYYASLVGHYVAANPQSINSLSPDHPTGNILRKDGTFHTIDLSDHLDKFRTDVDFQAQSLRGLAMGVILVLDVELHRNKYFGQKKHPSLRWSIISATVSRTVTGSTLRGLERRA